MAVTINSVAVDIFVNSLSISDAIEERSTASFTVRDTLGVLTILKGQPVLITDNMSNTIFAGFVNDATAQKNAGSTLIVWKMNCIDNHYLADKRIIAKAYLNMTAGDIVQDIITNYLGIEGVTPGTIQDGNVISQAIFNYVPITTALNSLADQAGFWWSIDFSKALQFQDRNSVISPWVATGEDIQANSLTVARNNPNYRNKQYIKGGKDTTDIMTETQYGDGALTAFTTGFPIAKEPIVIVNDSYKTIGIKGIDTNKDWYWTEGDAVVTQDTAGKVLGKTDYIEVVYQGLFNVMAITESPEAIDAMKTIEGIGTGIVEEVEDEPDNSSIDMAFQSGNAMLQKYAVLGQKIIFDTLRSGLEAGQLLTINVPEHNLNNLEVLIENVDIKDESGLYYIYTITAVEGPEEGSWEKVFGKMAANNISNVILNNISANEVLVTVNSFTKNWNSGDNPYIFRELNPSPALYPSPSLYSCFDVADRCKYMEFGYNVSGLTPATSLYPSTALYPSFDEGIVYFRKVVTKHSGSTTLLSTTYVSTWEANGSIISVKWYSGDSATDALGSGIKTDQQTYIKSKTLLEAIQINHTDVKVS